MLSNGIKLRAQSRLDLKWLKVDLQSVFHSQDGIENLWNGLINDGEVIGSFSDGLINSAGITSRKGEFGKYYCGLRVLTCTCCDGICGPQTGCNCLPCQKLEAEEVADKSSEKPLPIAPSTILDSWTWGPQPTQKQLTNFILSLNYDQQRLCSEAARTSLSTSRLQQRLIIFKRYFIALNRSLSDVTVNKRSNTENSNVQLSSKSIKVKSSIICQANPVVGLARVGSRAAMNFSFAFLRQAWRLGEDTDVCSELLTEALEALQLLPVATLFDESAVSPIWLEVVERSVKFLRQVVTGDLTSGRLHCDVPLEDQNTALNLVLELALQRGTLSSALDAVLLLLSLWEKTTHQDDNRSSIQTASAPILPFLRRFESISRSPTNSFIQDIKNGLNSPNIYCKIQQLPDDDSLEIDLRQAAVIMMTHLDRLSSTHIPSQSINKSTLNSTKQQVWGWGCLPWVASEGLHIWEALTELSVKQLCCSDRSLLVLTHNGKVYTIFYNSDSPCPQIIEGLKSKDIIKISSHIEGKHFLALTNDKIVYSWGNGDNGRLGHGDTFPKDEPSVIEALNDQDIIDIQCGATYCAAISGNGALYTWGRGTYGRLGHGKSTDCLIPTVVSGLIGQNVIKVACGSGDSHTLCVTDQGHVYSWGDGDYGKLGRGGSDGSNIPVLIDTLQNIEINEVYAGTQFSMALSKDGRVFSWGKGDGGRLGHATEEHVRFPEIIQNLQGKYICSICMGSGHVLALTNNGDVYGWGKNEYKQVCDTSELYVQQPVLIESLQGQHIVGICCGPAQSFVWSDFLLRTTCTRIPFVIDLTEQTFRLLDQLLIVVCDNLKHSISSHFPVNQEKECIAIVLLNLLQLQLHCIINNNIDVHQLGLGCGSKLLNGLKSRVVQLAISTGVISTIQHAAQAVLQAGWSILLPTANERAHTLSSLLPNTGLDVNISSGHRFMTDLLVWSLMADSGLETALNEALIAETNELTYSEETCEIPSSRTTIPLLHLVKQLLKNTSSLTQSNMQEFVTTNKLPSQKLILTPSLNLLLRFQRLLVAKIFSKDVEHIGATESLLKKYLYQLTTHLVATVNLAHEVIISSPKNFLYVLEILKGDLLSVLLPEFIVSLVLLQSEIKLFLLSMDWLRVFDILLQSLDKFSRLMSNIESVDADDIAWPGVLQSYSNHYSMKNYEDLPLIRKADLENHNLDGGLWLVINNKVYDVQDYRCDNYTIMEMLQKYAGKDASHIFSSSQHNLALLQTMEAYIVGNYCQPEPELPQTPLDSLNVATTILDTNRHLGYLLGLHAYYIRQSLPLQQAELTCQAWLNAPFLVGGLQVIQPPNPYEEKGETRSTNSTAGNTPTEPKINVPTKPVKAWQTSFNRIDSFIIALAESRLSDSYVTAFLAIVEQHSKQNNFLTRVDFSFEHPVEEIGRLLYAVLLKHLGLGYILFPILDAYLSQPTVKLPKPLTEMVKQVHAAKWNLIKIRQELNRSYKEVCIPLLERCRFLLYEVKPAVSLAVEAYKNFNVLYKEPRVKTLIKKVIKDLKCGQHTSEIQKPEDIVNATIQSQTLERRRSHDDIKLKKSASDDKISESKSETDGVNKEIKNGADKSTAESKVASDTYNMKHNKNCTDLKTELEEKMNVEKEIRSELTEEEKQKKLKMNFY